MICSLHTPERKSSGRRRIRRLGRRRRLRSTRSMSRERLISYSVLASVFAKLIASDSKYCMGVAGW